MRIGLAQMDMIWEDKRRNFKKSLKFLEEASEKQVDLLVFPEMSMTGFSMRSEVIGEDKYGAFSETLDFFRRQAANYGLHIGIGYVQKAEPKAYNRYAIIDPRGEILADYAKIHPFSYGREASFYQGGEQLVTCQVKELVTAPLICYDLRFPEVFQILSKTAQLILLPANWPAARQDHFRLLLQARALENQCFVAGINRTGEGDGLIYSGGSLIADPSGNVVAEADSREQLLVADLDLQAVQQYQKEFPVKKDRRDELYVVLSNMNI